jgi:hypothetical protein
LICCHAFALTRREGPFELKGGYNTPGSSLLAWLRFAWPLRKSIAHSQVGVRVPLVVRLEGTNVDKGKAILRSSGLAIVTADDLDDAAAKAVASQP